MSRHEPAHTILAPGRAPLPSPGKAGLSPDVSPLLAAGRPVVAIPARDEEARLPRLLAALARQSILDRSESGPGQRTPPDCQSPACRSPDCISPERKLDVVLVVNNSSDASAATAAAAAARHPRLRLGIVDVTYPPERAHVGTARRQAMDLAAGIAPDGVLLTTDADAVPADDWVERTFAAIAAGADLVGGRIVGDPEEEARLGPGFAARAGLHARYGLLRDELAALVDPLAHDPWPRHQDHTGASLAVRAEVYRRLGGLDPLPFREDLGFVGKARAAGFRLVHPPDVRVTVSARTQGRAPGGMADCVRTWVHEAETMAPVLVECPVRVAERLRLRRALRDLAHDAPAARALLAARGLLRPEDRALGVAALIEAHAADDPAAPATTPAALAIAAIERLIARERGDSRHGGSHAA